MLAKALLLIALLAQAAEPAPQELVRQLGSDAFAERLAAARALERLGRDALPALREARDADQPRVRARVRGLIERLERLSETDRLTKPTLIRLDFHERPLAEVIETISDRHALPLFLQLDPLPSRGMFGMPGADPAWKEQVRSRRVTLEAPEPVPFWEAIDRLCRAGGLQHDLHSWDRWGTREGTFRLFPDKVGTPIVSDSGPFRVKVLGLHAVFERNFIGGPVPGTQGAMTAFRRPADRDLNVRLAVLPEIGLMVRQAGPLRLIEATDEQGRSLIPAEPPRDAGPATAFDPNGRSGPVGIFPNALLHMPDPPPRMIRRLRGSVPVIVVSRGPDPVVVPLEGAAGKTFRNEAVTVTVHEVATDPEKGTAVEVSVRANGPETAIASPIRGPRRADFTSFQPNQVMDHLKLLDARGRELATSSNQGSGGMQRGVGRVRLTPQMIYDEHPDPDPRQPFQPRQGHVPVAVELRYYGFTQATTEIDFDLRDIPMP